MQTNFPLKRILITLIFIFSVWFQFLFAQSDLKQNDISLELPNYVMEGIDYSIKGKINSIEKAAIYEGKTISILVCDSVQTVGVKNGQFQIKKKFEEKGNLTISVGEYKESKFYNPIPLWFSIIPPLLAILFALIVKEVYAALFIGILLGTSVMYYYMGSPFFIAIFQGMFALVDTYILTSLKDQGHLSIIVFSMLIGAMVTIITRNGGMKGVVDKLSRYAKNARSGQLVTWLLGISIFFDDYANTLVVGNTMRPITDRLKISREKLAYIVDSTAAPIAAIAFVTTWIGAELSYIQDGIDKLGMEISAYHVFLNSLQFSYYPIFALLFILFLVWMRKDFGPMHKAEILARKGGGTDAHEIVELDPEEKKNMETGANVPPRWYNAVIPVMVVVVGTIIGLFYTGWDAEAWNNVDLSFTKKLSAIIGNADSYLALLWSSILGVMTAIVLTLMQKLLTLKETADSLLSGFKTMLTAVVILTLAWSIALVTEHLHTADFISNLLVEMKLSPYFVPVITFILAALVAFSTGSSWGTMAILYPLILPASWLICQNHGFNQEEAMSIFFNVVSCVLAGSVLGDHCSPISDTTILSSLASSCNHIEHVRTQLPYALTVGLVSIVLGTIPSAFGVPAYVLFPLGLIALYAIVKFKGKDLPITELEQAKD